MAKTAKQTKQTATQTAPATAGADLNTFAGAVAVAAVQPAAPATPRHYGASAAVLAGGALPPNLTKYGNAAYQLTPRGALRVAGCCAKVALGGQYPSYATLAATLQANGGQCTAAQYWAAIVAAGQNVVAGRPFSRKGSTICPSTSWAYLVAQGLLVPVAA